MALKILCSQGEHYKCFFSLFCFTEFNISVREANPYKARYWRPLHKNWQIQNLRETNWPSHLFPCLVWASLKQHPQNDCISQSPVPFLGTTGSQFLHLGQGPWTSWDPGVPHTRMQLGLPPPHLLHLCEWECVKGYENEYNTLMYIN